MRSVRAISLGDNTVYLLELDGTRVLIDTGPDFEGARDLLKESLRGAYPDVVIATHGHLDHAGLGAWWQEQGLPVALHPLDWPFATGKAPSESEFAALEQLALTSGAPPELAASAAAAIKSRRAWYVAARTIQRHSLAGRDSRWPTALLYRPFLPRLALEDIDVGGLELLHLPGHTPGNAVAWVPSEGWLFSGDQLLPGITPTPALQGHHGHGPASDWRFRSLPAFLDALRSLLDLQPNRCFPGHGEPFGDVVAVIGANLEQAEQRLQRAAGALRDVAGASLYEVAERLYPRAVRRRFWQIIATVQGLIDVLESRGLVAYEDGRWRLTQAASTSFS